MTVAVTGAGGQVGREVLRLAGPDLEVVGFARSDLDITDLKAVRRALEDARPDAVVNAAAYTAVDRAESEAEAAHAVNVEGARNVAQAAADLEVACVHISTDYVFDGAKGEPYSTDDPVAPLSVYGATKAEGERDVLEAGGVVLRTAWVFSPYDGNFVTTMLRLAAEHSRLRVVADQWGRPTAARDVACAALEAASLVGPRVLHIAGNPLATWHDLATETVRLGAQAGLCPPVPVDPIPTAEYPTPARRPARVDLEVGPSLAALGLEAVDWRAGLRDVIARRASQE